MAKIKTHEEAVAALEAATEARKAARATLDAFCEENKLNPKKNHSEDPKLGKAYSKLRKPFEAAKEKEEEMKTLAKELKPAAARASKYEYPADCETEADRKRFRAAQRRKANGGEEKAEKPAKAEKKAKVEETEAKPKKKAKVEETEAKPKKKKKSED